MPKNLSNMNELELEEIKNFLIDTLGQELFNNAFNKYSQENKEDIYVKILNDYDLELWELDEQEFEM